MDETMTGDSLKTVNNQAIINNLAEWLRAYKERPCLDDPGLETGVVWKDGVHTQLGYRGFLDTPHEACNGTGTITDPNLQAAWEMLSKPAYDLGLGQRELLQTATWPDWFWRGLLEQVVETIWPWGGNQLLPTQLCIGGSGYATIWHRYCWGGDNPSLFKAIIEALNARASDSLS